jgi:hypothetical protein
MQESICPLIIAVVLITLVCTVIIYNLDIKYLSRLRLVYVYLIYEVSGIDVTLAVR